jgi:hypothetical protein
VSDAARLVIASHRISRRIEANEKKPAVLGRMAGFVLCGSFSLFRASVFAESLGHFMTERPEVSLREFAQACFEIAIDPEGHHFDLALAFRAHVEKFRC